jgi:hypothetical protein
VVLLAVFAIYEIAKPGVNLHGAPEVRGLTLPAAEQLLRQKGYTADVHTNALFGVIIPQHFYVCSESAPQGKLVVVDAEKQC